MPANNDGSRRDTRTVLREGLLVGLGHLVMMLTIFALGFGVLALGKQALSELGYAPVREDDLPSSDEALSAEHVLEEVHAATYAALPEADLRVILVT